MVTAPERRVRRKREQDGQLDQHALHDREARLGRGHGDVHVHAEDELAASDVLEHLDQRPVAVAGGDLLVFKQREGMRAGGSQPHAMGAGLLPDVLTDQAQVGRGGGDVVADDRARLEHALHQLRLEPLGHLAVPDVGQDLLDPRDKVVPGRVEQHVLLLDPHRQRRPRPKPVVEHAGARTALAARTFTGGFSHERRLYPISAPVPTPAVALATRARVLRPKWRNGRRTRLKIARPQGHVGSTPTFGTPV